MGSAMVTFCRMTGVEIILVLVEVGFKVRTQVRRDVRRRS